jgi:galactose mutarotase-like enzyme
MFKPTIAALIVVVCFANADILYAATADSIVFSHGTYVVSKRTDGNGWIYHCADTAGQTYFEVFQTGGMIKKFVAFVHGVHYSVFNESNGMPKMMPWPNRTALGKFTDDSGAVQNLLAAPLMTQSDGLGNAIHGMVSGRPWQVDSAGADSEGVFLRCFFDTQGWPVISGIFGEFRDYTVYHLRANALIIDAYTQNNGDGVFSNCGWGFHPWINAPLVPLEGSQRGSRARCSLLMPADSIAIVNSAKIPTGEMQSVASYQAGYFDFNSLKTLSTVTVDNFFTGLTPLPDIPYTRSLVIDFGNKVRLQVFGQYPFYPWMVIYTPANMVCVEHQTEEVNGLNTKQRLIGIPAHGQSAHGRTMFVADDDTTEVYKPTVALRGISIPLTSMTKGKNQVFFSGSSVRVETGKSVSTVSCAVYTPNGKLVALFSRNFGRGGNHSIFWDKKDSAGRSAVRGAYIAVVKVGPRSAQGMFIVQ